MAVIGSLAVLRFQLAPREHYAVALDYLERVFTPGSPEEARILAMPVGRTDRFDLGGGVFALEQAYVSKPRDQGRYESHRAHVDLQAVVAGVERMDLIDVRRLAVAEDLSKERDLLFYHDHAGGSVLRVGPGEIAMFAPADAHMPSLAVDAPAVVRKTVVKVPVPA